MSETVDTPRWTAARAALRQTAACSTYAVVLSEAMAESLAGEVPGRCLLTATDPKGRVLLCLLPLSHDGDECGWERALDMRLACGGRS